MSLDKHMMDKDLAAQKLADVKPSPLVVNVPKNPITTPDPTTPTSGRYLSFDIEQSAIACSDNS